MTYLISRKETTIKTKLRSSCEGYYNKKTPYKYKRVISNLSKNSSIIVLKQDKRRGVGEVTKLDQDPTCYIENKVQRTLRKIKSTMPQNVYSKLYPSRSCPGKFYGTAKMHKLLTNDVNDLPLRPIISNIGTATYQTAKYLTKLFSPLGTSEYTISNTKTFVKQIRKMKVSLGYKIVSFDVTSLFTNVPMDKTIEIILKRVCEKKEIITTIPKREMKELLYLCTKNVHFSFNNEIYMQNDGVAMGSPLGPVLANIFMVELERAIIPSLSDKIKLWKRYVDDTIAFVKTDEIKNVLSSLNSYYSNIQFTMEIEQNNQIPFLDVLFIRNMETSSTTVYRKITSTDIYINWKSFAPNNWKWETLKTLVRRAYDVCSSDYYLACELQHLKKVFHEQNDYPIWVVNKVFKEFQSKHNEAAPIATGNEERNSNVKNHLLVLPYKGSAIMHIISSVRKQVNRALPDDVKMIVSYTGKTLSTCFNVKDKTVFNHEHDIVYYAKCPEK